MDYSSSKKKLMTQSVAFLQAHLNLCNDFLEALARDDVLTREEVTTVQVRVRADKDWGEVEVRIEVKPRFGEAKIVRKFKRILKNLNVTQRQVLTVVTLEIIGYYAINVY